MSVDVKALRALHETWRGYAALHGDGAHPDYRRDLADALVEAAPDLLALAEAVRDLAPVLTILSADDKHPMQPAATGAPCESWYVAEGVRCQLSAGHPSPCRYEGATPGYVMTWPTPAEAAPVATGGIQFDPEGHAISPTTGKPTHIDPDGWFGFANKERAGVYVEARGLESSRRAVRAMRDAGLAAVRGEAAPVAPLPWVVRWVASKKEIARCEAEADARTLRDLYVTSAVEVAPAAAPTVVPVKFNDDGDAMLPGSEFHRQSWGSEGAGTGWLARIFHAPSSTPGMRIRLVDVMLPLRPGEDAGETVAKMLAAVGRGP